MVMTRQVQILNTPSISEKEQRIQGNGSECSDGQNLLQARSEFICFSDAPVSRRHFYPHPLRTNGIGAQSQAPFGLPTFFLLFAKNKFPHLIV